jgi:hypothetical protein
LTKAAAILISMYLQWDRAAANTIQRMDDSLAPEKWLSGWILATILSASRRGLLIVAAD